MPFVQKKFDKSVEQSRDIFDKFIYRPENDDFLADVLQPGYFAESRFITEGEPFNIVECVLADGYFVLGVDGTGSAIQIETGTGDPAYFRAVSEVNQPIPNTDLGAVVEVENIIFQTGIDYTNGEYTLIEGGFIYAFSFEFNLGITAGFTGTIETWVEQLDVDGITWILVDDSLRSKNFDVFNEGVIRYVQDSLVPAAATFRVKIRATGGGAQTLESIATAIDGNPITGPSVSVSITKGQPIAASTFS